MLRTVLSQITNLEDALATIDNRNQEWWLSLSPLGQFLFHVSTALRAGYDFPLASGLKRYAGALYAIAEEQDIRDQLMAEREQLKKQRQVMLQLQNEIIELVRTNSKKIEDWKNILQTGQTSEGRLLPQLYDYYTEMIEYMGKSSERVVQAMKKVTTTAIDSEESLVFNDLKRHSSGVCFMQDCDYLRRQLNEAKEKRLQMERIRQDVLRDLDFLRHPAPLDNVHVASHSPITNNESHPT